MNESEVIERTATLADRYADRVPPHDLDGMRSMAVVTAPAPGQRPAPGISCTAPRHRVGRSE